VIVGSIHAHDAIDTIGLWGPQALVSGYNPAFNARLATAAVDAIVAAAGATAPAHLVIAKTLLLNTPGDPQSGTDHWNKDIRDPVIFDPTLTVARFVRADSPTTTIATVVNWADHPEMSAFGLDNLLVSAHFVHYLREAIEDGVTAPFVNPIAGIGGVTVYVQGALGGQIGSIRNAPVPGPDGTPITESGHPKEEALGNNLARRALEILRDEGETVSELPLSYRTAQFHARIENTGFQVAFIIGLLAPHPLVGYDPAQSIAPGNEPWMPMRATYLQVGPFALITAPGEVHPELWVGGYDGSWSWGQPIMDTTKPNAPDLTTAPLPPYLRDVMLGNPGVRFPILAGLAMDYCGYIVPAYNYVLDSNSPYIDEADGDHYEETYSLGPQRRAPRGVPDDRAGGLAAVTAPARYHFVEVAPVTADTLATAVNDAVAAGWIFDGIRFVMTEASRRPSMAFVSFVAAADAVSPADQGVPASTSVPGAGSGVIDGNSSL
jgi:hypothetical protein